MNPHLAALAFRRTLPPGVLALAVVALVVAGTSCWTPEVESLVDAEAVRGLARQGVWSAAALLLLPVLVFRAAGTVSAWRRGEIDWIGASPASRATVLVSTWTGAALGGALLVAAIGLAAELAAGRGAAALQLHERTDVPHVVLVEDDALAHWTCDDAPPAGALRVHVFLVAGAPAADVRFALEREDGARSEVTRRVGGRTELRAPIPEGRGALRVSLQRVGAGAIVALDPRGLDVLVPVANEWRASLVLFAVAGLALGAWLALALGLGTWVSGPIAAAVVGSVTVLTWSRGTPGLPWSGLPEALALVGERIVPAPGLWTAAPVTLALVAGGLLLGHAGLRTWRHAR